MKPQTTFAGKTNPFTGASLMKPVDHVDPSKLTIGNDPLPAHRARANKYADLMAKLKPGQCIKCKSDQVGAVASAVKKHIENNRLDCTVRLTKNYGDGMGRVWLMKNERKLKVA
jgi:hypothetical protein